MSKKQKQWLTGTTGRSYKQGRAKRRSSYEAYSDWYDKYSSSWEMKKNKFTETQFNRAYSRYQNLGTSNIAKTIALHSRAGTIEQVKEIINVIKSRKADITNLYNSPEELNQFISDYDRMNLSVVKANFTRYWKYVSDLVDLGDMDYDEVFSPKGEVIKWEIK